MYLHVHVTLQRIIQPETEREKKKLAIIQNERRSDSAESRVNGNQDFNCPSIRDNLIDRMTFTLSCLVLLIHPPIMTDTHSCYGLLTRTRTPVHRYKHTHSSVPSSPNRMTICSVSSNNKGFSTRKQCLCVCVCPGLISLDVRKHSVVVCTWCCSSVWWD